jgi:hypothetical protein
LCEVYQISGSGGTIELDQVVDADEFSAQFCVAVSPADLFAEEDEGQWGDHAAVVHECGRALHHLVINLKKAVAIWLEGTF